LYNKKWVENKCLGVIVHHFTEDDFKK